MQPVVPPAGIEVSERFRTVPSGAEDAADIDDGYVGVGTGVALKHGTNPGLSVPHGIGGADLHPRRWYGENEGRIDCSGLGQDLIDKVDNERGVLARPERDN